MALLKKCVAGSTLIEAIVASLIFLIVFVISLTTVTGFTLQPNESYDLLEAERQMNACFERYGEGTGQENVCTEEFPWGRITTTIAPHGDYDGIFRISLRAEMNGSRKNIASVRLISFGDD